MIRSLNHGFAELGAHPWRSLLSGVALCIGVLSVVAIFTISSVTAEVYIASSEQVHGKGPTYEGVVETKDYSSQDIAALHGLIREQKDHGRNLVFTIDLPVDTAIGDPIAAELNHPLTRQRLTLIAGDLTGVRRIPVLAGRWFDSDKTHPLELVLNSPAAEIYGGVGTVRAIIATGDGRAVNATIVGVVADGTNEPNVYVSLAGLAAQRPHGFTEATLGAHIHAPGITAAEAGRTLTSLLAPVRDALPEQDIRVQRVDKIDELLEDLETQRTAFLLTAGVTLLVAALGILNIGLASVAERSHELVIRRALGATRGAIVCQLLISAVVAGVLASGVAIAIAYIGVTVWVPGQIAAQSAITPPGLPWLAVACGVAAAGVTSLVGGVVPAMVASRMDVAGALRG